MATKGKSSTQTAKPQPAGDGNLYTYLLNVIQHLNPTPVLEGKADMLTAGDRTFLASILQRLKDGEDIRELFFEGAAMPGRPRIEDRRKTVALYVAIGIARREKQAAAAADAAQKSGLTDSQVRKAWKQHGRQAKEYVMGLSPAQLNEQATDITSRIEGFRN